MLTPYVSEVLLRKTEAGARAPAASILQPDDCAVTGAHSKG